MNGREDGENAISINLDMNATLCYKVQTKLERRWKGSETSCRDAVRCFPGPVDLNITFNKSRPSRDGNAMVACSAVRG
jgi:hypothetical protein